MTTDGSAGRRDGFERWVAAIKRDHQSVDAKPGVLKPAHPKLELELDENATHVHRIPKELIHRLREQAREEQAQAEQSQVVKSQVQRAAVEPTQVERTQVQHTVAAAQAAAEASQYDDEDDDMPLSHVQEDRTAVFRPPPELLARAKRMRAPAKRDARSEAPTKPPPALEDGAPIEAIPVAAKLPGPASAPAARAGFSSMPPQPRVSLSSKAPAHTPPGPFAAAAAPLAAHTPPGPFAALAAPSAAQTPSISAALVAAEPVTALVTTEQEPTSAQFATDEPASGVVAVSSAPPGPTLDLSPPVLELAPAVPSAPPLEEEEAGAPTTTSPVVNSQQSLAPEFRPWHPLRLVTAVVVLLALVAFAVWRSRHAF